MFSRAFCRILLLGLTLGPLLGCKKADPNPELKDPLYQALQTEIAAAGAAVVAAQTAVTEAEGEIKKVVPQTGQIKYAEKRYWDARNKLTQAEQKKRALEVKAEMRLWKARVANIEAFHQDKEWSDPDALANHHSDKELEAKPRNWSVKDRRAALGLSTGKGLDGDPTAAAAKKVEGEEEASGH